MALGKIQLQIVSKLVDMGRLTEEQRTALAERNDDLTGDALDKLLQETPDAVLARAEIVVVGHADAETRQRIIALAKGARVVDLNGYADLRNAGFAAYEGICW